MILKYRFSTRSIVAFLCLAVAAILVKSTLLEPSHVSLRATLRPLPPSSSLTRVRLATRPHQPELVHVGLPSLDSMQIQTRAPFSGTIFVQEIESRAGLPTFSITGPSFLDDVIEKAKVYFWAPPGYSRLWRSHGKVLEPVHVEPLFPTRHDENGNVLSSFETSGFSEFRFSRRPEVALPLLPIFLLIGCCVTACRLARRT